MTTEHGYTFTPDLKRRPYWFPRLVTCRCGLRTFTAKGMGTKHRGPLGPPLPVHTSRSNGVPA